MIQELGYRYGNYEVLAIVLHDFSSEMQCSQASSVFLVDLARCIDRHILIQLCNISDRFVFKWILENEVLR
jgi:hypothetical protein